MFEIAFIRKIEVLLFLHLFYSLVFLFLKSFDECVFGEWGL